MDNLAELVYRDDTPKHLVFSLGFRVSPGSGLVFIGSSSSRDTYRTRGSFFEQSRDSLNFLVKAAQSISSEAKLVKVRRLMTSGRGHRDPQTADLWKEILGPVQPASTALELPGSSLVDSLVDLEGWAVAPSHHFAEPVVRARMGALVPEVTAVRGDQVLCTAAVKPDPSDTAEGELLSCLNKILTEFREFGAGHEDVLKLTIYYRDPRFWATIEGIVLGLFGDAAPALTGVLVTNVERPEGHIQVSGWARCAPSEKLGTTARPGIVDLETGIFATTGTGSLPLVIREGESNLYAHNAAASIEEQAQQAMENQKAILEAAGLTFDHVFRSNWYLTDMREWDAVEPILRDYFGRDIPVPQVVEVSRLTAKQGVRFEPDLWAAAVPVGEKY